MSAGRGGSVSRRDHNHFTRNRPHLTGGTNSEEPHNSNASRSSGEGVWGRGASLREAPLPWSSPMPAGRGGSVSRRDHNQVYRRHASLQAESTPKNRITQTPAALRERGPFWPTRSRLTSRLRSQAPALSARPCTTLSTLNEGVTKRHSGETPY